MRTILHLSIVLMLVAGSAGTVDFIKMYRNGEIDKIYDKSENPSFAHVPPKPSSLTPTETSPAVLSPIKKKAEKITIQPKQYSPASLKNDKEEAVAFAPQAADTMEASNTQPEIVEVEKSIIPAPVTVSTDQKDETEKKVKPKKKFKLSMYSRGMIREEDLTDESDSGTTPATDSTTTKSSTGE